MADSPANGRDHINVWESSGIGHIAAVSTGLTPDPSADANARLIAAAPEMLGALGHVVKLLGMWKEDPECTCEDCVLLRPVYAAITKALGPDWQNSPVEPPEVGSNESSP